MRCGVSIGISPRQSLNSFGRLVSDLDREGVDDIWLIDSQLAMKDVYVGLTVAASQTKRARLGPGVTNPLTRHPSTTVTAMAALAELSGGRAVLGLGAGDSAVFGLGWKPAKVADVERAVAFFRGVMKDGEAEWEGRRLHLPHAQIDIPIYLAVSQQRMCRLAGRVADGAIVMGPADPQWVAQQVSWIEDGLAEAGRSREQFDIEQVVTLSAHENRATALDDVRSWATAQARLLADFKEFPITLERFRGEIEVAKSSYDFNEHLSVHAAHTAGVSDELAGALAIVGSVDECASRLATLVAAGIDGCIFPLPGGNRLERWLQIRDQVVPGVLNGLIDAI
jgi:5,10-methylenetetrahydromethanopterin reductase